VQQWREAGRFPRKGSRAFYILAPSVITRRETDAETGEETEKRVIAGFRCVPVFAVEDTQGRPIKYPGLSPPKPPPLYDVAQAWQIKVRYLPGNESYYGYYQPEGNQIVLCTHDLGTFFHELAHAAYHQASGEIKGGQDWRQEIIAELTAAALMRLYGHKPNDGYSYRYIRKYAKKAGKDVYRACLSVIADVGRCLELILSTQQEGVINKEREASPFLSF
jgi:antirestriction protein ArdC